MLTCSNCGADITDSSIRGACPSCVLALALGDTTERTRELPSGLDASIPISFPHPFGDYVLLEEIGRGGMGVVYRARQEKLNREVALKLILTGAYTHSENRRRFLEESNVAAGLQHPNIVTLFDSGEHEGSPFYTMELIVGSELGELIDQRALTTRRLAEILCTVGRAVEFAHKHHVIHRDLKPSNILIDETGQPQITDFGLAKRVDEEAGITVSGRLIGTPGFWPPEQLEKGRSVETSGDIYALGAILYAGLTGRPPFQADSLEALLLQIVSNEPIPPRRLNPDIPRDLETICIKCLQKNPPTRYADASDLATDLKRYLSNKPIHAHPVGPLVRLKKWTARKPALAATLAMLALTLFAGFTISLTQWQRAEIHADALAESNTRLRFDQAGSRLADGATSEGLALLADLLRDHPDHNAAAERIASVMATRSFIVPLAWHTTNHTFRWTSAFAIRGDHMVTAEDGARTLNIWKIERKPRLLGRIEVGNPVRVTSIDQESRSLIAATENGQLIEYDLKTLNILSGPHQFEGIVEEIVHVPNEPAAVVMTVPDAKSDSYRRRSGTIIHLPTGRQIHKDVDFHQVAFSPDGRRVVTLDNVKIVLRNQPDWKPVAVEFRDPSRMNAVVFSPNSKWYLTASGVGYVSIWDADTGRLHQKLIHPVNVQEILISPDGANAFTVDVAGQGRIWDLNSYEQIGDAFDASKQFRSDSYSSQGSLFLSHAGSGLRVYDPATGRAASEVYGLGQLITSAGFLRDGQRLIATSFDGDVRIWELTTRALQPLVMRDTLEVEFAAFSPDGMHVATGIKGSWAQIWNAETGTHEGARLKHRRSVRRVRWSADGNQIVTASRDRTARLWDPRTQKPVGKPMRHEGPVLDATFSPDGLWVATASEDGSARIWNASNGEPVSAALRHSFQVTGAVFRPTEGQLATYSRDRTIRFWSVPDGVATGSPLTNASEVAGVAFNPSGSHIVVHGNDEEARVWMVDERQLAFPPIQHAGMINSAQFDSSGNRLVTASVDDTARIWSATDGKPIARPMRHAGDVMWAGFSPDGRKVLTTSADGTAQIWDATTGQRVSDPMRHGNNVVIGEWSPDGSRVMTASYDHTVRIWPLPLVPPTATPAWLADLAEARGGLRQLGNDVFETIEPELTVQAIENLDPPAVEDPWHALYSLLVPAP